MTKTLLEQYISVRWNKNRILIIIQLVVFAQGRVCMYDPKSMIPTAKWRWEHHDLRLILCSWYWGITRYWRKREWNGLALEENLILLAKKLNLGRRWTLQQNSAIKHTAKISREGLACPRQSPDLNLLQHLLQFRYCKSIRGTLVTLGDLKTFLNQNWATVLHKKKQLMNCSCRHLKAVILPTSALQQSTNVGHLWRLNTFPLSVSFLNISLFKTSFFVQIYVLSSPTILHV